MQQAGSLERRPLAAPSPWLSLLEPAGGEPRLNEHGLPGQGWPKLATIDYINKLIMLIVLLLALPWILGKLLSDPEHISKHAGSMAMGA